MCRSIFCLHSSISASHTLMERSHEPEARSFPSGESATVGIRLACAPSLLALSLSVQVDLSLALCSSVHVQMDLLLAPDATAPLFCEYANASSRAIMRAVLFGNHVERVSGDNLQVALLVADHDDPLPSAAVSTRASPVTLLAPGTLPFSSSVFASNM